MSDRPADRARPAGGPLWFLADRDAFLRRFVLRTLLEPPARAPPCPSDPLPPSRRSAMNEGKLIIWVIVTLFKLVFWILRGVFRLSARYGARRHRQDEGRARRAVPARAPRSPPA